MSKKFELRSYQTECHDAVLAAWPSTPSVLATLCVAAGKTDIGLAVIDTVLQGNPQARVLWLAHREELVDQPVARIAEHWPKLKGLAGKVRGLHDDFATQIVVATIQTLSRGYRLERVLHEGKFDYLIVDEAHHNAAQTYRDLMARLREVNPALKVLGLTATPRGGSGKRGLGGVFNAVAYRFSTIQGIEHGVLCPFVVNGVDLPVSFKDVKLVAGDYEEEESGKLLAAKNSLDLIVNTWKKEAQNRMTLAYVPSVYSAKLLWKAFWDAGIPCVEVDGTTQPEDRQKFLAEFKSGKVRVMVNVMVYAEGTDIPEASCLLQCRPTTNDSLYLQIVGRVLRTSIGKEDALILDFAPQEGRDLVQAMDVLETPELKEKAEASGAAVQGEGALDVHAGLVEADPSMVRVRILNYLIRAPLAWLKTPGFATAALDGDRAVAVKETPDGKFEVYLLHRYSSPKRLKTCTSWEAVVTAADKLTAQYKPDLLAKKGEPWRYDLASPKQLEFLTSLSVTIPEKLTKGLAAQLVTDALCKRDLANIGKNSEVTLLKRLIRRAEDFSTCDAEPSDVALFNQTLMKVWDGGLTDTERSAYLAKADELGLLKSRPRRPGDWRRWTRKRKAQ